MKNLINFKKRSFWHSLLILACIFWSGCHTTRHDRRLNKELMKSIRAKSFADVVACVKRGANVNFYDLNSLEEPPLFAALGDVRISRFLIENGATWKGYEGPLLSTAIEQGDWSTVEYYLRLGFEPNADETLTVSSGAEEIEIEGAGLSPLATAAMTGRTEFCQLLLKHNADLNAKFGYTKQTALHMLASADNQRGVIILLDLGADPTAKDGDGKTPLEVAGPKCRKILVDREPNTVKKKD